ncbi:N-acetyltransferase [Niallia circulans]|uniref:GNAT family N-acetyltransferase n=1 Tax=Niallia TaxID=2837506 RepID=UPI00077CAF77|nr:GNAT family N-acetyltransferase [Niallia circulans]MCM2981490.1 GNAT family N-acetyltransferase [Niallia circulans]MDR4318366.1 GNAT family N-acetyltransferase [Niallia circulans]MED3841116.1 GNAT family N-acetyltransferase [Niallia circulans]MED4242338.1 GNAT family N-acetyltransferase [Niallia circulans]MED4250440.1 GNAT family N-acetyltransferase [Niallia circulans]
MKIRKLREGETPPFDLLLLADPSEHLIREYLKKGICYIAEDRDQTIGVYVLLPMEEETIELINLAVGESYQGIGLGKRLVMHAIEEARKLGYNRIEVGTGNSSISQLALYQKCGFRIDRIEKDFFLQHYEEEIYENGIQCMDMIKLKQDI